GAAHAARGRPQGRRRPQRAGRPERAGRPAVHAVAMSRVVPVLARLRARAARAQRAWRLLLLGGVAFLALSARGPASMAAGAGAGPAAGADEVAQQHFRAGVEAARQERWVE